MSRPEHEAVAERYARRDPTDRYAFTQPDVWLTVQERQRAMLRLFARHGVHDLAALRLVEVGSGTGGNLLEFLRMGLRPEHLTGLELLPERHAAAQAVLPTGVRLVCGDALVAGLPDGEADIVFVSTVFSSLLDDAFQQRLADTLWRWVRPGGAVLWYDFTVDNPRNRDVRGVPLRRVRGLFPQGRLDACRVTLAPPLARGVSRVHPALYTLLNTVPLLRTHALCWIAKP